MHIGLYASRSMEPAFAMKGPRDPLALDDMMAIFLFYGASSLPGSPPSIRGKGWAREPVYDII